MERSHADNARVVPLSRFQQEGEGVHRGEVCNELVLGKFWGAHAETLPGSLPFQASEFFLGFFKLRHEACFPLRTHAKEPGLLLVLTAEQDEFFHEG